MNKRTKPEAQMREPLVAAETPVNPDDASSGQSTLPEAIAAPIPAPVAEPLAGPAAVSAIGLPLDEFHGQGGVYVLRDGVRTPRAPAPSPTTL